MTPRACALLPRLRAYARAYAGAGVAGVAILVGSSSAFAQRPSGLLVAQPPVGLSFEYSSMAEDLGSAPCPPPAFVAELQRLGSPPLALAGDSQDLTAPTGVLTAASSSWQTATLYSLPAGFWSQLHCLLSGSRDSLTVGLNAKTGQPSWAQQMVAEAQSAATNGLDFSLGNEPDLYVLPNYSSLGKRNTDYSQAASVYLQVASSVQQAIGSVPLIGPEIATQHWQGALPRIIQQLHLTTVGAHSYALSGCVNPRAVTLAGLLSARAADAPRRLAWVVAAARAAQVPAIISEANSASCGGTVGVSDTSGAAVWAVRFVLSALKTGFREVRFHFSGGSYDPFSVRHGVVVRRPIETALAALNRWLPVGSVIRTAGGARGVIATNVSGAPAGLLLIFDNEHPDARTVVVRSARPVLVEELTAARTGLVTRLLPPHRGSVRVDVPGNAVVAAFLRHPA